jgi:prepilin-type N-terminal cleavage/methylation domain-containing protein
MRHRHSPFRRGFTLIETIMAMASVGVVGLSIFYTLYYGLLLFTKNTAMNVSHMEARLALDQLNTDIHQAVSAPSLTDSNGNMISGTSSSPGVEFQVMIDPALNCQVTGSSAPSASTINVGIPTGYPTPYAGMRLIIPAFETEEDVTAVSMSGTIATCTLAAETTQSINGPGANIPCFFTQRVYYYVNGPPAYMEGSTTVVPPLTLNYIGVGRTKTYSIGADDISTYTPFSIPSTASGTANYHYVAVNGLKAEDPQTINLNSVFRFSTSSIMVSGTIPEYSTLTTYQ